MKRLGNSIFSSIRKNIVIMQKPSEIKTATNLIYGLIGASFLLDVFELWTGDIDSLGAAISWAIYALITLIPYGLNQGRRSARTWFCICFAVSILMTALLAMSPESMSSRRWVGTIPITAIDLWIVRLLFSRPASAWLSKDGGMAAKR